MTVHELLVFEKKYYIKGDKDVACTNRVSVG